MLLHVSKLYFSLFEHHILYMRRKSRVSELERDQDFFCFWLSFYLMEVDFSTMVTESCYSISYYSSKSRIMCGKVYLLFVVYHDVPNEIDFDI
jgi:hypothetical protein